jgi:hypothetical protein
LLSGTSMATPHVAGAVALLRCVWSELTVPRAKGLLMEHAFDMGTPGEDNTFGNGRIDLQQAYAALLAERPLVAISVMGTRQIIQRGQTAWPQIVVSSYSANFESVTITIEVLIDNASVGLYFLPPTTITLPPGFNNRTAPLPLSFPIPANLDAQFLNRPIEVRGTVQQGATVLGQAGYAFQITP